MAPSLTTTPTILTLKQNFLTTQTRLLAQPAEPSRAWRRGNNHDAAAGDGSLPDRAVDDALYRLNHTIQQHARRVYASQATRHVAEQIDRLYLRVGERSIGAGAENEVGGDGDGDGAGDGDGEGDADSWRLVGADYGELVLLSF